MELIKYPRTPHLPWSESLGSDDKMIQSLAAFIGKRVIVTEKMDGENATLRADKCHARSCDSRHHFTRDWLKSFWSRIARDIPEGYRICGENLWAKHSIRYDALRSYFMGFSVWDDTNTALSWDETQEWFSLLGVTSVSVIYDGVWDEAAIKLAFEKYKAEQSRDIEGYVVRISDRIPYNDFGSCVCKFVRKGHVNPDSNHWLYGNTQITSNTLEIA